ncbi:LysR family transcriptional regulator [Variovorax boronicumulans]
MDLKRIANLIQVADHGSFSKAASVIGIAQPALGRQVRKLEEECGTPLLYRNGRGVSLTPDGETLLARLRPLLRQMESAVLELHDERESPSGNVTIGLTPTLCGILGMRLVSAMRRDYPRIQLNVITGYSGYVHEWLTNARVDIGVLHDARRSQHLIVDPLAALDLSLVSATRNLAPVARSMKNISFKELDGLPLVLPTGNHGLRRSVEYAASQAGIQLSVVFEIDALELMKEIVEGGLAHTVLADLTVQREVAAGIVTTRRLLAPEVSTRLMIASAANRPVTRAVKLVEHTLRTLMQEMALVEPYRSSMRMLQPDPRGAAPDIPLN